MLRVVVLFVLLCSSVTYANVFILSRNVDTNETTLSFEEEDITGPFITVGEDIDSHEVDESDHQNSTVVDEDFSDAIGDPDDPDNPDDEDYDDYDFTLGHLHATPQELENVNEPKPSNFPTRRRKNTKKRVKRPKRPKQPKRPKRPKLPSPPNRRVKRPTNGKEKRKRIRIKTDQQIQPAIVSQFISDINKNCPICRCGVQGVRMQSGRKSTLKLEFPWLAHLSYFGRLYCAGTLINDRYVLTAGHCTNGYIPNKITVRLLEYELSQTVKADAVIRPVEAVFRPPTYDPETLEDDISLLKLKTPVPIERITPICLPLRGSSFAGKNAIVAGWGLTMLRRNEPTSVLRKAVVPIVTNKRCRRNIGGQHVTERMLCAGYRRTSGLDACQVLSKGDSGGPLMIRQRRKYRLAGIASHGQNCGERNHPGVYTRVTKYRSWISQITSDACWCRE